MKKAAFKVEFEGRDVSSLIADRLISLVVQDSADDKSDSFTLILDNRDDLINFPKIDGQIGVWIGYDGALVHKGTFFTDEVSEDLTTGEIDIQAKATRMTGEIKAQKTKTWGGITLGGLADQVAAQNGMVAKVHPEMDGVELGHVNQRAESDMALLTRLTKDNGGMMKVFDGRIVITPKASGQTASGTDIPLVVIDNPSTSEGRVTLQERGTHGAVQASYFDEENQVTVNVVAKGGEGPVKVLKTMEKTPQAALAKARAHQAELARGNATMSLTRPLTPEIVAPGKVHVKGHRKTANGIWFVESVTHTIGGSGVASSVMSLTTESYEAKKKG